MKVLAIALALCFAGSAEAATRSYRPSAVKHSKLKKGQSKLRKGPKNTKLKQLNANRAARAKVN